MSDNNIEHTKLNVQETKEILAKQDAYRCSICGAILDKDDCVIDHIYPRSLGGSDEIDNLILSCHSCNIRRGNRMFLECQFEQYIRNLLTEHPSYSLLPNRTIRSEKKYMPDIVFEKNTDKGSKKYIGEIKTNQLITESRILHEIIKLKEFTDTLPEYKLVFITASELTQEYKDLFAKYNIELWDKEFITQEFSKQIEIIEPKSFKAFFGAPLIKSKSDKYQKLIDELKNCSMGAPEWGKYQKIIKKILEVMFCPPLDIPIAQSNDSTKKNRRDFVMPNYSQEKDVWNFLRDRYNAEFVVIETKNSSKTVTKQDVLQIANYLKKDGCGLFGIIISRKGLGKNTKDALRDKWLFDKKMIVVLDDIDIEQMILEKKNGNDPAELIKKKIEDFRLSI